MKGFYISVKNDLLEPKHFSNMGKAIWLYLWLLDKMTSVTEDGVGKVLGGKPIKYEDIGLGFTARTYGSQIKQLEKHGYIKAVRTPYGYIFTIYKAKKFFGNDEIRKKGKSIEIRKKGRNKEDNTAIDNTNTCEQSSRGKKSNLKSMKKNKFGKYNEDKHSDFEEVVDLESGEYIEEEPKPKRTYPIVYKIFEEVLGRPNPLNWKMNTTQQIASENLLKEHTEKEIHDALRFCRDHKGHEYCPVVDNPFELDFKWAKIKKFKDSL